MKKHQQYVNEQIKNDPVFARELAEAEQEVAIALAMAEIREKRGLTQQELAESAGLKQPQIARLESGTSMPSVTTLLRVLKVLNATIQLGSRDKLRVILDPNNHQKRVSPEVLRANKVVTLKRTKQYV